MADLLIEFLLLLIVPWVYVLFVPTCVLKVKKIPFNRVARGVSCIGIILLREDCHNMRTLRHESVHIFQMKKYSPLGLLVIYLCFYGFEMIKAMLAGKRFDFLESWHRNPYEAQANSKMDDDEMKLPALFGHIPNN